MEKNRAQSPGGQVTGLFSFVLQACFAAMALLIVLFGARIYQNVEQRSAGTDVSRTAFAYIAGKVRANGGSGVSVREEDGVTVLVLAQQARDAVYNTYIYGFGGSVCEYFGRADRTFQAGFGEPIIDAASFAASQDGELLTISMTGDTGTEQTLHLFLGGGGA